VIFSISLAIICLCLSFGCCRVATWLYFQNRASDDIKPIDPKLEPKLVEGPTLLRRNSHELKFLGQKTASFHKFKYDVEQPASPDPPAYFPSYPKEQQRIPELPVEARSAPRESSQQRTMPQARPQVDKPIRKDARARLEQQHAPSAMSGARAPQSAPRILFAAPPIKNPSNLVYATQNMNYSGPRSTWTEAGAGAGGGIKNQLKNGLGAPTDRWQSVGHTSKLPMRFVAANDALPGSQRTRFAF